MKINNILLLLSGLLVALVLFFSINTPSQAGDRFLVSAGKRAPMMIGGGLTFITHQAHTEYGSVFLSSTGQSNDSQVAQTMPMGGTLLNLNVNLYPNTDQDYYFTILKNGVDTTVACPIQSPATSCDDSLDSVNFNPGDTLSIRAVGSGHVESARWTAVYR